MKLTPLKATKETVDVKRGGIVIYETAVETNEPGIIMLENPNGEYGVVIINQVHPGGQVHIMVRPVGQTPVKKYAVGDIVGQLATF